MKKVLSVLACLILIMSLAGCDLLLEYALSDSSGNGDLVSYDGTVHDKAEWTILVYMNGSDLESDYGMATNDLAEMVKASYNRDDIRIVIETGGTQMWRTQGIPNRQLSRLMLSETGFSVLETMNLRSMGQKETLTDFVDFGMTYFPAKHYALVMWNHGGGAVSGYGVDQLFDYDGLTLGELSAALGASKAKSQKFDFIGFDACLMATAETAWALRDYAHFLVASEEVEPGYGWDYTSWLTSLGKNTDVTGAQAGKYICDSFVEYYVRNGMSDELTTLSVTDLSQIQGVVKALEEFVAVADLSAVSFQQIAKPRSRAYEFGMPSKYSYSYDMIDIVSMAQQYGAMFPQQAQALVDAVGAAVVYRNQGPRVGLVGGLSIFFPFTQRDEALKRVETYKTSGFSAAYINYVAAFTGALTGVNVAPFTSEEIAEIAPVQQADEYAITLTQKQIDNIKSIQFTVWFHEGDNVYTQIHQDSFVEIDQNGRILTEYDGSLTTINDEWACLYLIDYGSGWARYAVPAELNGEDVVLVLMFDDETPDGRVLGALPLASTEYGMAPRQMVALKDGDTVALIYYAEEFFEVGADPNKVAQAYLYVGTPFTVRGELMVESWQVLEGEYMYGFTIVDLQGNEYYTNFIVVEFSE